MKRRKSKGVAVFVDGKIVAWFKDPKHVRRYARRYYFGQWLAHRHKIPALPQFSPSHWKVAERGGRRLMKLVQSLSHQTTNAEIV